MNQTDPRDCTPDSACPLSSGGDFEETLHKAQALLDAGDVEGALLLLEDLELKYVRGIQVFDLLGDALLRQGNIEDGIRYKTLHEVVKGTFKIAGEEKKAHGDAVPTTMQPGPPFIEEEKSEETTPAPDQAPMTCMPAEEEAKEEDPVSSDLFPRTAEMGNELMRQGHFERALAIFDSLLRTHPEDHALNEARERAHKKTVAQKLLGVLQRWLLNIEKMRAQLPTRP